MDEWVRREMMRMHLSLQFVEVPEHEMIQRSIDATWSVTLGHGHNGRYAVPQFGRRWWKALGKIILLGFRKSWYEYAEPEKTRSVPRDPNRTMAIIKGVTS